MRTTPNHLIHIGSPIAFEADKFLSQLQGLLDAAYNGEEAQIRSLVSRVVTTYAPAEKDEAREPVGAAK